MNRIERHLIHCMQQHLIGGRAVIPEGGVLVWRWFLDLCRTRSSNGHGPNPISHAEIEAYARLQRWPLEPRHIDLVLALDRVWLDHMRGYQSAGLAHQPTRISGQVITPEAFDAVFG